ncbi:hypothetical protein [Sandaracinus amylolyticus]|uniref:Transmembrane protein n=1 Tax=Sandaracinus amylolyticus TaxID=927083 RepID=A0A0F6W1W7_9BACT|nr:hypothetical protein [Sandaracinus amylolyticus]AKF05381.1 hypothetical protein DB32_002530 [Sandaracinus amylolyticus]
MLRGRVEEDSVRLELLSLSVLAATALAALIDSARRAGPSDADDETMPIASPSATLELLQRTRARLDDHPPRVLIALGVVALIVASVAPLVEVRCLEISAVLGAAGVGLAVPGLRWAHDVRRERRALDARIHQVRTKIASSPGLIRSGAPLPRS